MPHCKFCEAEFIEGIEVCNDCGRTLTAGPLPLPPEPPPTLTKWKLLRECSSDLDAELLKQLLEAQQIPVLRKGGLRGSYASPGVTAPLPGERIQLLVPEDHYGLAMRLLRERIRAGRSSLALAPPPRRLRRRPRKRRMS